MAVGELQGFTVKGFGVGSEPRLQAGMLSFSEIDGRSIMNNAQN